MLLIHKLVKKGLSLRAQALDRRKDIPAGIQQEQTLRELLFSAAHTAFGNHYNFISLLKSNDIMDAYRKQIPVYDYDSMHDNWWYRCLQGEADVCWDGIIKKFALSSGTSGSPSKYIPVTKDMTKSMQRIGARNFLSLPKHHEINPENYLTKEFLMIGGSSDLQDFGNYKAGDLSGINANNVPLWLRTKYKPTPEIVRLKDWNDRINAIAEQAPEWDIGGVTGIPSWVQLTLERVIEYHNLSTIHDIWPNLSFFVHGGIAFEPYKMSFKRLLRKPITYIDTYLASEGFFAYQSRLDARGMELMLDNNIYFEFVPFNSQNFDDQNNIRPTATALTIEEVQENTNYALLISTNAGAWRYLIGDTVMFSDLEKHEIVITGRTKHFLSICGEHLSVDNMNQAIHAVEQQLNIEIREFTACGITDDANYHHKWYIGCHTQLPAQKIATAIDEELKRVNDDYRTERDSLLQPIQLEVVPINTFYDWLTVTGKSLGQSKFPRVMKPSQFREWAQYVSQRMVQIS